MNGHRKVVATLLLSLGAAAMADHEPLPATVTVICGPRVTPRFEVTFQTLVRGRTLRLSADSPLNERAIQTWSVDNRGLERNAHASLCFDNGIPEDVLALDPPKAESEAASAASSSSASPPLPPQVSTMDPRRCVGPRSGGFVVSTVTTELITGHFTLRFGGVGFLQGRFDAAVVPPGASCLSEPAAPASQVPPTPPVAK